MTHTDLPFPDDETLDRYLAGVLDPHEHARIEALLDARSATHALLAQARVWPREQVGIPSHSTQDALRALNARLDRQPIPSRPTSWRRVPVWAYAMAATVVVAGLLPMVRRVLGDRVRPTVERTYATTRAQHASVQLPDGSRVMLAPETELRYRADTHGARTIELLGEAYFSVTHDPARTFVVRTGAIRTQVLGTAFSVRHYPYDTVRVHVVEGKVSAGVGRAPSVLIAGEEGRFTDSTAVVVPSRDATAAPEWTRGQLVFKEAPVSVVLASVGRWYGYEFRVADSTITTQHVTTTLLIDKPEETLQALKEVLGVTMTYDGHVVTLRSRRRTSNANIRRTNDVRPQSQQPAEVGK